MEKYSENSPNEIPFTPDLSLPEIRDIEETRRTSDLPLGEGVTGFDEDCIIGEIEVRGETLNLKAIHHYNGKTFKGEHPAAEHQGSILDNMDGIKSTLEKYHGIIDNYPDQNDNHQDVIRRAQEITGVQNPNIKILGGQAGYDFGETQGSFIAGHVLIQEGAPNLKHVLTHELNHHGGDRPKDILLYSYQTKQGVNFTYTDETAALGSQVVDKYSCVQANSFFEEAAAEVKNLRQLSAAGEFELSDMAEHCLEYENFQSTFHTPKSIGYPDSLHAITVFDKMSPGLIDDLVRAHDDRAQFQTVIDRLDEIHPNLYKTLRDTDPRHLDEAMNKLLYLTTKNSSFDIRDIQNSVYDLGVTPD